MSASEHYDQQRITERLEILWHKLDAEGLYTRADTAWMAQQYIAALEDRLKELEDRMKSLEEQINPEFGQ